MDLELSIITVTRNDPEGLKRTIQSLIALNGLVRMEQIVIDGSPDESFSTGIKPGDFPWPILVYPEASPTGIYPAMNVGALSAKGRTLWFLNSGDILDDASVVKRAVATLLAGRDVVSASARIFKDGNEDYIQDAPSSIWGGLRGENRFCHQAVIYFREFYSKVGFYDNEYKLAADYDHLMRSWRTHARYAPVAGSIVCYNRGGVSDLHFKRAFQEFRAIQLKHVSRMSVVRRLDCMIRFYFGYFRVLLFKRLGKSKLGVLLRPLWIIWKRF